MAQVGDRVLLSTAKRSGREGVVTAVTGSLVRIRWPSQEETTIVPAAGALTVLGSAEDDAVTSTRTTEADTNPAPSADGTAGSGTKRADANNAKSVKKKKKRKEEKKKKKSKKK